jgi:putative hydrolase of HD superfamily
MKDDFQGIVKTLAKCSAVKEVAREGWRRRAGVASPESVADHIFSTTLAAMITADALHLDVVKMMKMALLHDICEAITGDVQPGEMAISVKVAREEEALSDLLRALPGPLAASYLALFEEFNRGTSQEALLVRDLDKLEMAMQAGAYERKGVSKELLDEFWRTAEERIRSESGRKLLSSAASLRPRRSAP